jgi:predicted O-methyltransferase YrrM
LLRRSPSVAKDAMDPLQALGLADGGEPPFDLVFIDADKPSDPRYLELALELVRSGSVVIGDDVVRDGSIADERSLDPSVVGVRRFCSDPTTPGPPTTAIQTVGGKGYDGFTISYVP